MSKGRVLALMVVLSLALQACATAQPGATSSRATASNRAGPPGTFTNPVLGHGQDPSVVYHAGWYYFTQSVPGEQRITVRRARSLLYLAAAPAEVVWKGARQGSPCCQLWAPELHQIGGRWYIYFAADNGSNHNHRLYVIQARRPRGPYRSKGELATPQNRWSIDPTILDLGPQRLYLLWSGWPSSSNGVQDIYIARLTNPWTVSGPRTMISSPTYPWETHGAPPKVNEAPEALLHDGRVFVTYSASGCWTSHYALGLLWASADANLLSRSSWHKSDQPVLSSNPTQGVYGPGSNGFFTSPNGKQTWTVFHAVSNPNGNCGAERFVWAQPVTWGSSGMPHFGRPSGPKQRLALPAGDPGTP